MLRSLIRVEYENKDILKIRLKKGENIHSFLRSIYLRKEEKVWNYVKISNSKPVAIIYKKKRIPIFIGNE